MDPANCELAAGLVSSTYIRQGGQSLTARHKMVKALLANRRLPDQAWDEATIEMFIQVSSQPLCYNNRPAVSID